MEEIVEQIKALIDQLEFDEDALLAVRDHVEEALDEI